MIENRKPGSNSVSPFLFRGFNGHFDSKIKQFRTTKKVFYPGEGRRAKPVAGRRVEPVDCGSVPGE